MLLRFPLLSIKLVVGIHRLKSSLYENTMNMQEHLNALSIGVELVSRKYLLVSDSTHLGSQLVKYFGKIIRSASER